MASRRQSYWTPIFDLKEILFLLVLGLLFPSILLGASHDTVTKPRPRIGLALGGGGALGFAHIAVVLSNVFDL
jgi:hypothetical protein